MITIAASHTIPRRTVAKFMCALCSYQSIVSWSLHMCDHWVNEVSLFFSPLLLKPFIFLPLIPVCFFFVNWRCTVILRRGYKLLVRCCSKCGKREGTLGFTIWRTSVGALNIYVYYRVTLEIVYKFYEWTGCMYFFSFFFLYYELEPQRKYLNLHAICSAFFS